MSSSGFVVDVLDMEDNQVMHLIATELDGLGTKVVKLYGVSNGIMAMIDAVIYAVEGKPNSIRVLRFWGHGYIGGDGQIVVGNVALVHSNVDRVGVKMMRLRLYFINGARVELRGCEVASGNGKGVMLELAKIWNVNIHGSEKDQILINTWTPPVKEATPDGGFRGISGVGLRDER